MTLSVKENDLKFPEKQKQKQVVGSSRSLMQEWPLVLFSRELKGPRSDEWLRAHKLHKPSVAGTKHPLSSWGRGILTGATQWAPMKPATNESPGH